MDNEIARYIRRAVTGFHVTDETIDADQIARVGIGGNYLGEADTARHFRELLNLSPFFQAAPWGGSPTLDPKRDWEDMARERARELLRCEVECPLTPNQVGEVDAIVEEAAAKAEETAQA